MFADFKTPLFEHRAFRAHARLRRCLALSILLFISLWLLIPHWRRKTQMQTRPWGDPVRDGWLSAVYTKHDQRGPARIGKVTMAYGPPNAVYERTLASHERHAYQHGYPMFRLNAELLNGVWSKLVYVMTVVSNELQKPPMERLEWIFWHDADTYILNPNVALDLFLPPDGEAAFRNVSLLIANDHVGLQAGTFMLRIDSWAIELLSAAIALPRYRPDMYLKLAEQTALEYLVDPRTDSTSVLGVIGEDDRADYFHQRTVSVPQRWINAYLGRRHWDGTPLPTPDRPVRNATYGVEEGDLLIHSSGYGISKLEGMAAFMNNVERHPEKWARPIEQTGLREEADAFWKRWKHASSPTLSMGL